MCWLSFRIFILALAYTLYYSIFKLFGYLLSSSMGFKMDQSQLGYIAQVILLKCDNVYDTDIACPKLQNGDNGDPVHCPTISLGIC